MGSATVTLDDGRVADIDFDGEEPPSEEDILSYMDSMPQAPSGLIGGQEATLSATPNQNFLESAFAKVFGKEVPDVYKDSSGNRIQDIYDPETAGGVSQIPELESQARARNTATGMGVMSSLIPGIGQAKKVGQTAGAVGKILEYGKLAGLTSATGLAADKASQVRGDLDQTSLSEDLERFGDEVAFGTAIPAGAEGLFSGIKKAGGFLKGKLGSTIEPGRPAQIIPGASYEAVPPKIQYGPTRAEQPPVRDITKDVPAKGSVERGASYEGKPAVFAEPENKTFGDVVTAQDVDKSLKRRTIGADNTIEYRLDEAAADLKPILDLPPEQSLAALDTKQESLIEDIGKLVTKAEEASPKSATVDFANTEKYISTLPKGSKERATAEELLAAKKEELFAGWDGSVVDLQDWKIANDRMHRNIYNKDSLTANENLEGELAKYISSDMRTSIEKSVPGIKELNNQLSKTYTVEPIVRRRFAQSTADASRSPKMLKPATGAYSEVDIKPPPNASKLGPWSEGVPAQTPIRRYIPGRDAYSKLGKTIPAVSQKVIPGPWQGTVDAALEILGPALGAAGGAAGFGPTGALVGGAMGATAGRLGGISNTIGQASGALGKLAGALGETVPALAPSITRLAPSGAMDKLSAVLGVGATPVQAEEMPEKLPRNSADFKSDQLASFLMQTTSSPKGPIAQQLVSKLQDAVNAQDMDKVERLHADMTRIFPELFEQGTGVNGKVFYPDEQIKVMENLRQLHRQGQVDSIHLAKQRNAFMNPMDSRILPVARKPQSASTGPNKMVNGTRQYAY